MGPNDTKMWVSPMHFHIHRLFFFQIRSAFGCGVVSVQIVLASEFGLWMRPSVCSPKCWENNVLVVCAWSWHSFATPVRHFGLWYVLVIVVPREVPVILFNVQFGGGTVGYNMLIFKNVDFTQFRLAILAIVEAMVFHGGIIVSTSPSRPN